MTETLGEKLRQAREARNYSIRELADLTRIAPNYLEAIEADNYKILPGGIFNKGFIRSFAKAVGVDEKEALADYLNLIAEQTANQPPDEEESSRRYQSSPMTDTTGSPIGRLLLTLLVLGLVSAGIYFGVQYLQNNGGFQAALPPFPAASPTPTTQTNANTVVAESTPTLAPLVVDNGLNAEVKAVNQAVSLTMTADGKKSSVNINQGETKNFSAQQSLKFSYYKLAQIEMILNGKPVKLPSANPRMNGIEFEITRENAAQFVQ